MKTSIATISLAGSFREKLEAVAAAGFDGVEIFEQDLLASEFTPGEVGAMVREAGLEITLFQPFRDFEGLPEPHRARAFARAARKFGLMKELGAELMLVCSSVHPASLGGIDRMAEDFRALGGLAADHGVRVGFEALAWGRHVNDHRDAWEVVRRADHPAVGLILDSFHTLAGGIDPETIRSIPGDRIFFVQLADAPGVAMDLLHLSRHFRSMPGEGALDVAGFMRAVAATGYSGPLSLEIFNDLFRAGLPRLVAVDGLRSLVALMDRVRRAEPALAVDLAAFPPPAPPERVEFIEFVAGAEEAPRLESLLAAMGFAPAGAHVSKSVALWRQGGVNILVNTETRGFARSSYVVHGLNLAEIGLTVPDAEAALARARALGAAPHEQPPAAGELSIPAIRGVGGGMLRLLDRKGDLAGIWDVDFRARPGGVGAGLTGIDHIGQITTPEALPGWALFYASIFGAEPAPIVDVTDPHGLVRSQALRAGGLRVTLNAAEGRGTLASRFLEETFGSAVQHVAFATEDMFATAEALAARGFPALRIGRNYYEDVEARFGLDPAFAARLAALDLMYDEEEEGGRFLQLFSLPGEGGIFFEIVQRMGGYAGYGAANAPFRIAAQKRAARPADIPRA